jgi:hypothetical protein
MLHLMLTTTWTMLSVLLYAASASAQTLGAAGARAEADRAVLWNVIESGGGLVVLIGIIAIAAAFGAWIGARQKTKTTVPLSHATSRKRPIHRPDAHADIGTIEPKAETSANDPHDRAALRESDVLFGYFQERFGVSGRSASDVIDFLTAVAASIDRLRDRADTAEDRAEALDEALRMARQSGPDAMAPSIAASPWAVSPWAASPWAASWQLLLDNINLTRTAMKTLEQDRAVSADLDAFVRCVQLVDALRQAQAARIGLPDDEPRLQAGAVEEAWPHAILRANALLTAYYPGHGAWRDFRDGLAGISVSLRHLLRLEGVAVAHAPLLTPYEATAGEQWSTSFDDLMSLAPSRRRIRSWNSDEPLIVDCDSFGFVDENRGFSTRSRLVVYNGTADYMVGSLRR